MPQKTYKTLRLILGDQLNQNHSWFKTTDNTILYVLMEIRTETDYVQHHIQKVVGFIAAMRRFAELLKNQNHCVHYFKINDIHNAQSFDKNCSNLIQEFEIQEFQYQLPDEYRLDEILKKYCNQLQIRSQVFDSEHFYSTRNELENFFKGKKIYLMESFYRYMRQKHNVMMADSKNPLFDKWNFDEENRQKLPKNHVIIKPLVFENDVTDIVKDIEIACIKTIGNINPNQYIWTIDRNQALEMLDFFVENCLPLFGTFQDAMTPSYWSLYHSRLSFAINIKLISPQEVVNQAIEAYFKQPNKIQFNQLEGFVRQIIGWREYMRGIYWTKMPEFATLNYFENANPLPDWFWTGNTKMSCLKHAITQSLDYAYAHHIQRLMITGNFALLAGVHPDFVDEWYLGIYIDAIEWVEITNTRGMSQYADGGIVGSKPYTSSAAYISKMSSYCDSCHYDKSKKIGEKACPFNSFYWNFYDRNETKLSKNPRIGMVYNTWKKMSESAKNELLNQANYYLENINSL